MKYYYLTDLSETEHLFGFVCFGFQGQAQLSHYYFQDSNVVLLDYYLYYFLEIRQKVVAQKRVCVLGILIVLECTAKSC